MEIKQLNFLNQLYITTPDANIPIDVCPRYEIAHPERILALADSADNATWSELEIHDQRFKYKFINKTENFHIDGRVNVNSSGFFIFTDDTDLFSSVSDLLACAHDPQHIYSWMRSRVSEFFGVTCPILQQNRRNQLYSICHTNTCRIKRLSPTEDPLSQLITDNCFIMCNGMTLLIALHRAGLIKEDPLFNALCMFVNEQSEQWFADMSNTYFNLYVSSSMPQIAEFPYIYACMGKTKAANKIINLLLNHYNVFPAYPVITGVVPYRRVNYTSCITAALPYIQRKDMSVFNVTHNIDTETVNDMVDVGNSYCTLDVFGLLHSIVATRSMWKWWRANSNHVLHDVVTSFNCKTIALSYILKRLFFMYNKSSYDFPKSRVRKIWVEILQNKAGGIYTKHDLYSWVLKYMIIIDVDDFNKWLPLPPVAFLWDAVKILDIDIYNTSSPAVSFHSVLLKFGKDLPLSISYFRSSLEKRILKRLALLKRICSEKNKSSWDAIQVFYKRNPKLLYN